MTSYELQILGDSKVGETALINRLCFDRFTETHNPTIQDSYRKYFTTANDVCLVDILDTGDLTEIPPVLPQKPASRVLLVADKIDQTQKRLVPTKEGRNLAKILSCGFFETSAKEGINIENVFPKFNASPSLKLRRQVSKQEMKTPMSLFKLGKAIPNRSNLRWKRSLSERWIKDKKGNTPLWLSTYLSCDAVTEALWRRDALTAVLKSDAVALQRLLAVPRVKSGCCAAGQLPFCALCAHGRVDAMVVLLLNTGSVDINASGAALCIAACDGNAEMVWALLCNGQIDPNLENRWF
ncbi:hypothetical protein N7448_010938 [Penicillium atrosanguineum]|nr:hypothetical protein N7448_010938 [Penicillium atrosanguineum]